ncbi:MAG: hypothetical protein LBR22_05260 [Desulfovibrio sp.]|nr:hypothetical protein [Desulfovibrio sp.]
MPSPFRALAGVLLALALLQAVGCTTRPVVVVEEDKFLLMTKNLTKELQARRLLGEDMSYTSALSVTNMFKDYGPILYRTLSPKFLEGEDARFLPPASSFSRMAIGGKVRGHDNGFTIDTSTHRIDVDLVAMVDWDEDGETDWIVACKVDPRRGGRSRTYYVLVRPPAEEGESLTGSVAAVAECFGATCTPYVRESKSFAKVSADPSAPPTEVQELLPGMQNVTGTPAPKPASKGLEERSL